MNNITELRLVSGEENVLNGAARYVVPLYQRAFAWGTGHQVRQNEIVQLMDDVMEWAGATYHLGSLIVAKRGDNEFEVIDGQQRLTALFLIFARLGLHVNKECLSYVCRPTAETALFKVANGTFSRDDGVDDHDPACGIYAGINAIDQKIANENARLKEHGKPEEYVPLLVERFKRVVLLRVVVPERTDLNRYFEVMNTRGEQLEQQDIVKADLMSNLADNSEKSAFATIWDACSDMDGYCQMHFHNVAQRDAVFGGDWAKVEKFGSATQLLQTIAEHSSENQDAERMLTFRAFLDKPVEAQNNADGDAAVSRFEGIIDFPHFLLHVLHVYHGTDEGTLDDKNLITAFKEAQKANPSGKGDFARQFIWCLLKCRYLFDRYLLKRETLNTGGDAWSLKELVQSVSGSKRSASYRGSTFTDNSDGLDDLRMLQACLRVSYLDPKAMRWITRILNTLYHGTVKACQSLVDVIKKDSIRTEVKSFLSTPGHEGLGVATPHLVLNYLDYLLWKKHEEYSVSIEGFEFEYRSSVEHWYPQHPTSGDTWGEDVDRFGNLCILRGDINSKFSNLLPKSKQLNQEKYLNPMHQSLKLRIMADLTDKGQWDRQTCKTHEEAMLELLENDTLEK